MRVEEVAVVGLGYVGLPLAVALARKHSVIGFDRSASRVAAIMRGEDWTGEVESDELRRSSLRLTNKVADLTGSDIFIVAVPTPIDKTSRPDLTALLSACDLIGPAMSPGAVVVFESTVYPGVTEDICADALENASGLRCGTGFTLGYSPERINPGDKMRRIEHIIKVVAGQDEATLDRLVALYGSIIEAGIHRAPSIRVAEAAKVIENTQRDVNIALMNEFSRICDLLEIRTSDVLAAAGTKWNFGKFYPGLVGGHCIGVDPYYLATIAEQLGYQPQVILSGRRINEEMGSFIAKRLAKMLTRSGLPLKGSRVGILGLTFKENVPDVRNSKVLDVYEELRAFGLDPMVHDPRADPEEVHRLHGIRLSDLDQITHMHGLVLAVPHDEYVQLDATSVSGRLVENGVIVDVRSRIDPGQLRPDVSYWSL